jgi:hypothetical protein
MAYPTLGGPAILPTLASKTSRFHPASSHRRADHAYDQTQMGTSFATKSQAAKDLKFWG